MSTLLRVLVVDDHPVTLEGLCAFLRQMDDIDVVGGVESGATAIEQVVALQPDVLLLDCRLPVMPGENVAAEVRRLGLPTRVLAFSAFADEEHVAAMLAAGAKGYLLKTEPPEAVSEAIRAVGRGESRFSAEVKAWVGQPESMVPFGASLSRREADVLKPLAQGECNKEIAHKLRITLRTVEYHLSNVYRKLGVRSRLEAALWAQKHKLIP